MTRVLVVAIFACLALAFGVASVLAVTDTSGNDEDQGKAVAEKSVGTDEGWNPGNGSPKFLEDPESYPPGIARHLEKHGSLPPGLEKKLDTGAPDEGLQGASWVPPGLARKDTVPPGLAKKDKTPPGWGTDSDEG